MWGFRVAVTAALVTRLMVFVAGQIAVGTFGFPAGVTPPPRDPIQVAIELPSRWDTGWYVGLASGHYKWDGALGRFENVAFFPAYPLALQGVAFATGATTEAEWNWTGVVLSTGLLVLALTMLWQ